MNDKTAQSMADELRLAAPSGDMAGLNGWGNLCNEAAAAIDNLRRAVLWRSRLRAGVVARIARSKALE